MSDLRLWVVIHKADTANTRPAVYFDKPEADKHAAGFSPGFAAVVELGDVAEERERCAKLCENLKMPAWVETTGDMREALAEAIRGK